MKLKKEHKYKIIKLEESEDRVKMIEKPCKVELNMEAPYVKEVVDILRKVFSEKTTWDLV